MVGSSQKSRNCVRTTMKDAQQITCQSSLTCTRDPNAWTTIHQQETMTQHPHAVADHGRRQHLTASDLRDPIRQIYPRHHLGSRVVNKYTMLFKTMSGIYGRALEATSPGETQRHGTLWTTKQWKRLAHYTLYVRCAAFFDTLSRESLMLISMGRSEDILACIATTGSTRDEEQEEQCVERSGGSVGARQSLTERQPGNPVEEGAARLRSSTDCDPEGRQRCDVLRTMRDVWEWVAVHSPDHGCTRSRDEAEQSNSACVHLQIRTPHHAVPDQKPTRSPKPKPRLHPALTWSLESVIAGHDFERRLRFPETSFGRMLGSRGDGGTAWENTETS